MKNWFKREIDLIEETPLKEDIQESIGVKNIRNQEIISPFIEFKIEKNIFYFLAKNDSLLTPTGSRIFKVSGIKRIMEPFGVRYKYSNYFLDRYLSTDGSFVYITDMTEKPYKDVQPIIFFEVLPDEHIRIYDALQKEMQQNKDTLIKVSFPQTLTEVEALQELGANIDPKVEIVFE